MVFTIDKMNATDSDVPSCILPQKMAKNLFQILKI